MPLKSMTAFAAAEHTNQDTRYRCEIKTLNSRYLDINMRLPRALATLEPQIISKVKETLQRGKVDLFFDIASDVTEKKLPTLQVRALTHYLNLGNEALKVLKSSYKELTPAPLNITDLFKLEGVLQSTMSETADENLAFHGEGLLACTEAALTNVVATRSREGSALQSSLTQLVDEVTRDRAAIAKRAPEIQKDLYANLKKRLDAFLEKLRDAGQKVVDEISHDRLTAELVMLTDKADIAEELTRLEIHEKEFLKELSAGEGVGRKLDFLCQEMHREVNTMSNKLVNPEVAKHTLNLKQTVERIRQQVQNIE